MKTIRFAFCFGWAFLQHAAQKVFMAVGTQALRQKVSVRIVPPAMVTSVPESTAAIRRL